MFCIGPPINSIAEEVEDRLRVLEEVFRSVVRKGKARGLCLQMEDS